MKRILSLADVKKRNATFAQLIQTLFVTLILVTVLCGFLVLFILVQQSEREFQEKRLLEADRAVGQIDNRLLAVRDALVRLSTDGSIIYTTLISSGANPTADYNCAAALSERLSDCAFIRDIYLYACGAGTVCSAKSGTVELALSGAQKILERSAAQPMPYHKGELTWISIEQAEGKVYLLCGFLYSLDRPAGILAAELLPAAFSCSSAGLAEGYYCELLFPGEERFFRSGSEDPDGLTAVSRQSGQFDYRLDYYTETPTILATVTRAMKFILPLWLLLAAFDMLLAFDMAHVLYAPMRKLVHTIQEKWSLPRESLDSGDAYQFVARALESSRDREQALSAAMRACLPHILESVCQRLMEGRDVDADKLQDALALDGPNSALRERGSLIVFAFLHPDGQPLGAIESELILLLLQEGVERLREGEDRLPLLLPRPDRFALLGAWEAGPGENPEAAQALLEEIAEKNSLRLECSGVFPLPRLQDLRMVFQEASRQLERQIYYLRPDGGRSVSEAEEGEELISGAVETVVRTYCGHVDASEAAEAVGAVEQGLDELFSAGLAPAGLRRNLAALRNELMAFLITRDVDVRPLRQIPLPEASSPEECRAFLDGLRTVTEPLASRKVHAAVVRMQELVQEYYTDSTLSLGWVADRLNMNQSYLSALFTREWGEGFLDYLNNYRVEKAKDMLECTETLVKEVGFKVGFSSAQSFNRVFKRCTGMTPGQYQRSCGKGG